MAYLGSIGYNDSPEELGEPSGFWRFENYATLWQAFEASEQLNRAFDTLGDPTYSHILAGKDDAGVIIFHVLVLSTQAIYPRERELLAKAHAWLQA